MNFTLLERQGVAALLTVIPLADGFKPSDWELIKSLLNVDSKFLAEIADLTTEQAVSRLRFMNDDKKIEFSRLLSEVLIRNRQNTVSAEIKTAQSLMQMIELDSSEWDSTLTALVVTNRLKQSRVGR